jgi:FkbM family methyltransferase
MEWGISLLNTDTRDIPITHLRSSNRLPNGGFIESDQEVFENHFLDIGAHQGESIAGFTEYLRYYNIKHKYSITCFEPSRQAQIWAPLTHTAIRFQNHYQSVHISNFAVSSQTGFAIFRDDGSAGSTLHEQKPLNRNCDETMVPTVDINQIISALPTESKNIIVKLNIEGAEYEVLQALINNQDNLCKITELWLDFHGHQFPDKWKYLRKEIDIFETLNIASINCYDVDFMSGFYNGYDVHPPLKQRLDINNLIKAYLDLP